MYLSFPAGLKKLQSKNEQISIYESQQEQDIPQIILSQQKPLISRLNPQNKNQSSFLGVQSTQLLKESSMTKSNGLLNFLSTSTTKSRLYGNRKEIIQRANSSIRELSQSNRLRSQQKIKNQQICFRFKLKMVSILRQLKFPTQQIDSLQAMSPENFILSFSHKLKNYLKEIQRNNEDFAKKLKACQKIINEKTEQISLLERLGSQKDKEWNIHKQNWHKEIKQLRKQLFLKQEEITWLNIKIHQQQNFSPKHSKQNYDQNVKNFPSYNSSDQYHQNKDKAISKLCQTGHEQKMKDGYMQMKQKKDGTQNQTFKQLLLPSLNKAKKELFMNKSTTINPRQTYFYENLQENDIKNRVNTQNNKKIDCFDYRNEINRKEKRDTQYIEGQKKKISSFEYETNRVQQENSERITKIIEQWKNQLIKTVDYYQQIVQKKDKVIKKLQKQLKYPLCQMKTNKK